MKRPAVVLLVILAGCAGTTPAPVEYLLRPPMAATAATAPVAGRPIRLALGRLRIAPYLDQSGIVVATGDHRIEVAQDHVWAEPLSHALRRMLQVQIASAAGEPVAEDGAAPRGIVIDVNVHRLHGSLHGEVMLDADWRLRDAASNQVLGRYRFDRTTLTDAPGYDALVQAHVTLLAALADAIAASLPARSAPPAGS